ncbi:MAG: hydroxymethylglutaryl-CoA reductase [Cytophagaceae bacterium]
MSTTSDKAKKVLYMLENSAELIKAIKSKDSSIMADEDSLPVQKEITEESVAALQNFLKEKTNRDIPYLEAKKTFKEVENLKGNIENYIGMTMIPTGVIGPVRILGTAANGDYYVPMATSEGALVASYHRGAKVCRMSGGITSICMTEAVQRSPVFKFNNIGEVGEFLIWVLKNMPALKAAAESTTRHGQLLEIKPNIEGNHIILTFEYLTGDAAGQNMVTIATDAVCKYIIENTPVKPQIWFIEGNYSGDKKATTLSFTNVRGKKVTAEIEIPASLVTTVLKTTPQLMHQYWQSSTIGVIQSGAIGAQGHFANGLAALFLACGQDAACVSEAATGITRMEITSKGNLYVSVTLPSLIIGTVGGGTSLPTQKECLRLIDCEGPGTARRFAEICGAVVLAGEISIAAALSAGHFANAHKNLGRK